MIQQSVEELTRRARDLGLSEDLLVTIFERSRRYARELPMPQQEAELRFLSCALDALSDDSPRSLRTAEAILREIDLRVNDINPHINLPRASRVGVFGWGLVGPGVANINEFRQRLEASDQHWLEPFNGFGPDNFVVGKPRFDFDNYRDWILERFEANKFSQLQKKMGTNVLFAIGAFIQALHQNPGIEQTLQELGIDTHVYVGTGVGDIPLMYDVNLSYYRAQRRWNRFWADPERCEARREYEALGSGERRAYREQHGTPADPSDLPAGTDADESDEVTDAWHAYWMTRSEALRDYLRESAALHDTPIRGDIEREKVRVIKKRLVEMKKLNARWEVPPEPWTCVSSNRIWNIDNIPAAQITMLGRIHGPSFAPIGACSGFDIALGLGLEAIRDNRAKAVIVGMTDPPPHPLLLGAFYDARVISCDGEMSRPLEGLKGTHVSGGSIVWILGDLDVMMNRGHRPVGCEIVSSGASSDAFHIITPSNTGPRLAIQQAIERAQVKPEEIDTWDLHATATPGDWTELQNTTEMIGTRAVFTARKGVFGHGMSVGGGWELTAQHMAMSEGKLFATQIEDARMHPDIHKITDRIVTNETCRFDGKVGGKINMGIGGINGVVFSRVWKLEPTIRQLAAVLGIEVPDLRERLRVAHLDSFEDEAGVERVSHETYVRMLEATEPSLAERDRS